MISSLRGLIQQTSPDSLVVDVGGVGLKVFVPTSVFEHVDGVGKMVFLHTHLIVREDALTLYGFASEEQRSLFETLLGVQGVGPKLALAVLSFVSPDNLRRAVGQEQPELLDRVPGVGKKTAEKIVFHLKDKFGPGLPLGATVPITDLDTDVLGALTALGYSVVESQAALQSIPKDAPKDVEERVRLALQYFAKP
ncbi:MAG TPA: Holliday junction branch migration protein RuvA [Anaerolineales bacterium]|nr:Holliday junction branch migration protein RuvA [Anaerolineales bacterium]